MVEDMRVSGKMGNNMVTASLQILKVIPELVYGLMGRGQGGSMNKNLLIFEKVILFKAFMQKSSNFHTKNILGG